MISAPEKVLQAWLIEQNVGVDPDTDPISSWPIYSGHMPDEGRDNAIAVYGTEPIYDARILLTGETVLHPGLQIRVRSNDPISGYEKAWEITLALDSIEREGIEIDGIQYMIHAIHHRGIIPLGPEDAKRRRRDWVVNAIGTLEEMIGVIGVDLLITAEGEYLITADEDYMLVT